MIFLSSKNLRREAGSRFPPVFTFLWKLRLAHAQNAKHSFLYVPLRCAVSRCSSYFLFTKTALKIPPYFPDSLPKKRFVNSRTANRKVFFPFQIAVKRAAGQNPGNCRRKMLYPVPQTLIPFTVGNIVCRHNTITESLLSRNFRWSGSR